MFAQEIPEAFLVAIVVIVGGGAATFVAWLVGMILRVVEAAGRLEERLNQHDQDRNEDRARLSALEARPFDPRRT